ncbi:MAG: hypothetical protein M1828_001603 [Chrysothrix sp. TS-e1954]|nr:MAG: hypothetical protein M1828_001603 [Chrysothrix sp. TS-e1954]
MGLAIPKGDRSQLAPPHKGYSILPNYQFLASLLRNAYHDYVAVRDVVLGLEKTYGDLLSDALRLRAILVDTLSRDTLDSLERDDEVFIGILAPGGYEYTVAFVAILALGAAVVPMSAVLPAEEAQYYVRKSQQAAIVIASDLTSLGETIAQRLVHGQGQKIPVVPVLSSLSMTKHPPLVFRDILLSADPPLNPTHAALVIFTSGTTGSPKGAVLSRGFVVGACLDLIPFYQMKPGDVLLHVLPVHHATGTLINFLPILSAGATIEFKSGNFDAGWAWQRWRQGGIAFFSGVPTIFMRMKRHYEDYITKLVIEEREAFEKGARDVRCVLCGTSALPRPLQEFWAKIRRSDTPILTRYGATEIGAIFRMAISPEGTPEGSVGTLISGVDVELRDDDGKASDEGEILVRSPWMLSRYLNDQGATSKAHDYRGYYQTGDIARREGSYYFMLGRASQDIIKSGGYKISALDIERELLSLAFISEATVVGVEDEEWGQRVGAIVTLRTLPEAPRSSLTINNLRDALRGQLAGYKLPTLLRVVKGDLPKGPSGKVLKMMLKRDMFPVPGWDSEPCVQAWARSKERAKARL